MSYKLQGWLAPHHTDRKSERPYHIKKLIEWEQRRTLEYKEATFFLNEKSIDAYRFLKNYYFMAGDNGINWQDSRYWGMLPEEYIMGKAWILWKAVDPYTGKFRWERLLNEIN